MIQKFQFEGVPIKMWASALDDYGWKEVKNLAKLPFAFRHIALMPDAHAGKGMPIGAILAAKNAIIPNAVGVDIGCGICALKSDIKISDLTPEIIRKKIMRGIRRQIPIGRDSHKQRQDENLMPQGFDLDKTIIVKRKYLSALKQIGTLGGGNHFIELQKDAEDNLWVMIHSGSRNLGSTVGEYYNEQAEILNRQWFSNVDFDAKLAFLPVQSREAELYRAEMEYCIAFAYANRKLMMERIKEILSEIFPEVKYNPIIDIPHNYASNEEHFGEDLIIHRKGAVKAGIGDIGIIPGSQGTKSYIVEGLGNPESFCSSSHGAGRKMSRTEAVNTLSLEDEIEMLDAKGIVHTIRYKKDLEEASGAYKDIDEVMENQKDLVKTLVELYPIAVIKA